MTEIVIFDTSVLVDLLRTGRHQERMDSVSGLIRSSAVVLAELWRGATQVQEQRLLQSMEKNHPVISPTLEQWSESGQILARMAKARGFSPEKVRDLHFDVLIALTARSLGARLITSNRSDFELICSFRPFKLEVW